MLNITEAVKTYRKDHVSPDSMPKGYVYRDIAGVYVFDTKEEADVDLVDGMERVLKTARPGEGVITSTGASYESVYAIMAERRARLTELLHGLTLINQDELVGADLYMRYMIQRFFDFFPELELDERNWIIPDSNVSPEIALDLYISQLRSVISIRLAMLGIGPDADPEKGLPASAHVAFIKPGTPLDVLAEVVDLDETTRFVNSGGHPESYPAQAISHGPANLVRAQDIFLLAKGRKKQRNIARVALGGLDLEITATVVHAAKQKGQALTFFLDQEAARTTMEMLKAA